MLNFEKVKIEDNKKVMCDMEKIAVAENLAEDIEVYQSQNRNLITVKHNGYFYHLLMGQIVDAVLMGEDVLPKKDL